METLLALCFGVLLAAATWLLLSRSLLRIAVGLLTLGNAANIAIFAAGRIRGIQPPLVAPGESALAAAAANPLPQALVLTAIVISFGLTAFALVLMHAAQRDLGTLDTEKMREAEPVGLPAEDPATAAAIEEGAVQTAPTHPRREAA